MDMERELMDCMNRKMDGLVRRAFLLGTFERGDTSPGPVDKKADKKIDKEIEELLKELLEMEDLESLSDAFIKRLRTAKYLFVIDMGCGSTSAAFVQLEDYRKAVDKPIDGYISPILWRYVDPFNTEAVGKTSTQLCIPTLIGYSDIADMTPVIGPEALLTGYFCENFKEIPSDKNLKAKILHIRDPLAPDQEPIHKTRAEIWQDYFYALLTQIIQRTSRLFEQGMDDFAGLNETSLVMVAHPAGKHWSSPEVLREYKALVRAKTGLAEENILTVSEAKAAMQYVRRKYKDTLDFSKGVIVIDIGASTIDVEYLSKKDPHPMEFSLTMAGRDADRLLAHYVLEYFFPAEMQGCPEPDQIPEEDFFLQKGLIRERFLYQIRVFKERICTNKIPESFALGNGSGETVKIYPETLCGLLGDEQDNPLKGTGYGGKEFFARYTGDAVKFLKGPQVELRIKAAWYEHLENIIRYMMHRLRESEKNLTVGKIIVTGGSCQLLGLHSHILKAVNTESFRIAEEDILYMNREHDYENCVPFGGAFYVGGLLSHFDALTSFPEDLRKELRSELNEVAAGKIADQMFTHADTVLLKAFDWWRDRSFWGDESIELSVSSLKEQISKEKTNYFNPSVTRQILTDMKDTLKTIDFSCELPRTKKVVTDLLEHLAGKSFTGEPCLDEAEINISDPEALLSKTIDSIDYRRLAPGFFSHSLPNETEWLGKGRRKRARKNYEKNKSDVKETLRKEISDQLYKDMEKTDIFGVPDQILKALRSDIARALYVN